MSLRFSVGIVISKVYSSMLDLGNMFPSFTAYLRFRNHERRSTTRGVFRHGCDLSGALERDLSKIYSGTDLENAIDILRPPGKIHKLRDGRQGYNG